MVVRKGEMMQVISNLVTNSMYAMSRGGRLLVGTEDGECEGNDGVVLLIEDSGRGIATENLHRVFEPFFTTRGSIGTGILGRLRWRAARTRRLMARSSGFVCRWKIRTASEATW